MRRVVVVGGIDPGGGAGLTADAGVLLRHQAMALPVVTALTVQNRQGFQRLQQVPECDWRDAFAAACADGAVDAIKLGLLASPEQAESVAEALAPFAGRLPIVIDPVLSATAGGYEAVAAMGEVYREALAPRATVLTPNLPEFDAVLGGTSVAALWDAGCAAVLLKGGHGDGAQLVDRLLQPQGSSEFAHQRLACGPVHGTGCALASAVAARLAAGEDVSSACAAAIDWLQGCLRAMGPGSEAAAPRPLQLLP